MTRVAALAASLGVAATLSGMLGIVGGAPASADEPVGGQRLGESGLVTDLPSGVPAPPALPAACYLVADLDSGDVILAKCPHTKALPASTLKTLTALALVPAIPPTASFVATNDDAAQDGTKVGMVPGARYTAENLFQALLMTSGNDAAWALATSYGLPATLSRMNEIAAELGARDTVAKNPSGLDADGQTTSAYDLALLGRAALANPDIARYVSTVRATFPGVRIRGGNGERTTFELLTHNKLLLNYAGTLGVKNGFTEKAQHTFIGAARRGDRAYLVTYVGNTNGQWRPTAALLDWAFANGSKARAVGRLVNPGEAAAPAPEASAPAAASASAGVPGPGVAAGATAQQAGGSTPPAAQPAAQGSSPAIGAPDWVLYGGATAGLLVAGVSLSRLRARRLRARRRAESRARHAARARQAQADGGPRPAPRSHPREQLTRDQSRTRR